MASSHSQGMASRDRGRCPKAGRHISCLLSESDPARAPRRTEACGGLPELQEGREEVSALTCALDFSAIVRGREPCTGDLFAMTHRHPFDGVLGGALCMQHREAFKPGVLSGSRILHFFRRRRPSKAHRNRQSRRRRPLGEINPRPSTPQRSTARRTLRSSQDPSGRARDPSQHRDGPDDPPR